MALFGLLISILCICHAWDDSSLCFRCSLAASSGFDSLLISLDLYCILFNMCKYFLIYIFKNSFDNSSLSKLINNYLEGNCESLIINFEHKTNKH